MSSRRGKNSREAHTDKHCIPLNALLTGGLQTITMAPQHAWRKAASMRSILRHKGVSAVSCPPRHEDKASLSCIAQEPLPAREPGRRDEANATARRTSQAWPPEAKLVLILEAVAARNRALQFQTGGLCCCSLEACAGRHQRCARCGWAVATATTCKTTMMSTALEKVHRQPPLAASGKQARPPHCGGQQAGERTQCTLVMRMKGQVYAESTWRALSDA